MTTYELEVDDAVWDRWRESLPPGTTPDRRISDLLIADIEGRIDAAATAGGPSYACPMCEETFESLDERDRHLVRDHEVAPI